MRTRRWILTLPLALVATMGSAIASSVKDQAGLFGAEAVRQADTELKKIERENAIAVTVETVKSLDGETVKQMARVHAQRSGTDGVYVLIAKDEHKIDVISSKAYQSSMDGNRLRTVQTAFEAGLRSGDFDAALLSGIKAIDSEVSSARSEHGTLRQGTGAVVARNGRVARPGNRGGGFGIGSLLGIGLFVLGVLFVMRLIGSLFGGGMQRGYGPGRMGAPGYGAPGMGGGGGFMSSMFGGIGGALAGNWLYDQFSGRHQGGNYTDSSSYGDSADAGNAAPDWSSGGDAGGGDWGGGGGGGDWGGGGGGDDGGSW